jgi:hypothetical protein
MKKTSNKAGCRSITWDFPNDTHQQIPLVFFVFGLILIFAYLFKSHLPDWLPQKNVAELPGYVWISKSPEIDEGLYLLHAGEVNGYFPTTIVTAIQFDGSGQRNRISLPAKVANVFFMPIAINSADKELLSTLPGIGSTLAERIITRRKATGGFKSPGELLQIDGIGPKKLARIREHILIN